MFSFRRFGACRPQVAELRWAARLTEQLPFTEERGGSASTEGPIATVDLDLEQAGLDDRFAVRIAVHGERSIVHSALPKSLNVQLG